MMQCILLQFLQYIMPAERGVEIIMIGPEVDSKLHKKVIEEKQVKVTFHRGLYHKYSAAVKPHLVVGESSTKLCQVVPFERKIRPVS